MYVDFTYISNYIDYPDSKIKIKNLVFAGANIEYVGDVEYTNGDLSYFEEGKRVESLEYKDLIYLENKATKTYLINGTVKDTFECFSENYIYEMDMENIDTWLVKNDSNSDYWKSGTITINGLKYVYEGENVTLSKNEETETYPQQEILENFNEVSTKSDCLSKNKLFIDSEKSILE
jgi:hypothetical protein